MQTTKLRGIIPPMITPLKGNDCLDREGTVRLTEHLIKGGVHAIFILGTTGEALNLTYRLRYEFVSLVCEQAAGRVPVLVGVTDTAFDESVRLAEHAAKCGAVGVVAAPPYYFAPSHPLLPLVVGAKGKGGDLSLADATAIGRASFHMLTTLGASPCHQGQLYGAAQVRYSTCFPECYS